jgi:hypothetical protein
VDSARDEGCGRRADRRRTQRARARRPSAPEPRARPRLGGAGFTSALPKDRIGFFSNHGIKPAHDRDFQGSAKINQDRGMVTYPVGDSPHQLLVGVYDGHGQNGELCSEFICFTLSDHIEADKAKQEADPVALLTEGILKTDQLLLDNKSIPSELSGSTAIVALMRPNRAAAVARTRAARPTRRVRSRRAASRRAALS